jgi:hypothetical protein
MVRYFVFISVCHLLGLPLCSQNIVDSNSATVVAYWKKGESKTYLLEKKSQKHTGKEDKSESASFKVKIEVLKETDSSYTLDWRYNLQSLPGLKKEPLPLVEALCNNLHLIYETDETGSFKQLNNLAEIQKFVLASFDVATKAVPVPPETLPMLTELKKSLTSREGIENVLLKDVQLFHTLYGLKYFSAKDTTEAELTNVFGGEPFPAVICTQFTSSESNGTAFNIETTLEVDKKAATRIIVDFLNKSVKSMGKEPIDASEFSGINIKDTNRFKLATESGWVQKIYSERLSEMLENYKKEIIIFTIMQ